MKEFFLKNLGLKLLSIVFAISLWLFVNLKATEEKDFQLPLRWINLPSFLEIRNPVNDFVRVRVSGARRILSNLNPRKYPVVLDLTDAKAGLMDYQITEKMVSHIPGLKVEVLPPDTVQFKFELIVTKEVPVKPNIVGKPPVGYVLERVEVVPERIEIIGAQSEIMGTDFASTRMISLSELRGDFDEKVKVEINRPHVWASGDHRMVQVHISITEQDIGKWFRNINVKVENPKGKYLLKPSQVDIYLKGPAGKIQDVKPEDLYAFVAFPDGNIGMVALSIQLRPIAEGILAESRPAKVVLTIESRKP